MGFEELAGLKQLLSKRTQAEKPGRGDAAPRGQAAKPAEGQRAAKPQRSQASKPHGANGVQGKPSGPSTARPVGKSAGRPAHAGKTDGRPHHGNGGARQATGSQAQPNTRGPRVEKRQTPPVEPVVITIGQLQKRFPNAFPKNPAPKLPLKLGISKDLIAQAEAMSLSEPELLEAIKVWCQGSRYWAAMTKDAPRVDLEGKPEGIVTPEQAARARSLLSASRRAKRPQAKKPAGEAATATEHAAPAEPTAVTEGASTTVAENVDASAASMAAAASAPAAAASSTAHATGAADVVVDATHTPSASSDHADAAHAEASAPASGD